jgi:hypothetical protein
MTIARPRHRVVQASLGAALASGWCTAAALVGSGTQSSSRGPRWLAEVVVIAGAVALIPSAVGGLLGGLLAAVVIARRPRQSLALWCFKGAVVGSALGCAVMLVAAALVGVRPPLLGLLGLPGVVAGGFAGAAIGAWAWRGERRQ